MTRTLHEFKRLERPARPCRDGLPSSLPRDRPEQRRRAAPWLAQVCLCLLLAVAGWSPAAGETRVALVVGNGSYANFRRLDNPPNDAGDVADALEGLGFQVIRGTDVDRAAMVGLVARFVERARSADVSMFYYAGHGFQVDQQNYLVPTDAAISSAADVAAATIRLDEITRKLAGGPGIHLFFLDACRDNPLPPDAAPGARDGLAQVGDAAGFLFAFATQPDNVAYDGVGRNSFFTRALLGHVGTPGQDIATTMIEVRRDVIAATGGRQVPWENSSLTRQFAFAPGDPPATPDTMWWQFAAMTADPGLLRAYLDRYPGGAHEADAEKMLADLAPAAPVAPPQDEARNLSAEAPLADAVWDFVRRTRSRQLLEAYLVHVPDGPHGAEAEALLAVLPRDDDPDADPGTLCDSLATAPHDATAATAGVPFDRLGRQAPAAIAACSAAAAAHPELQPHYTALLGRATYATGDHAGAAKLYRDAADGGDVRAMASLALMRERGDGVPRDIPDAIALYQAAADGGNEDGAVNLAVLLLSENSEIRDPDRALRLLRVAADAGSAEATHNLGVLAKRAERYSEALADFRKAAALGEPRAYVAGAIILDEGHGVPKDAPAAADMLLSGVASDYGAAFEELTENASKWDRQTIRAVQERLKAANLYAGALDGLSGRRLEEALLAWRNGGYLLSR